MYRKRNGLKQKRRDYVGPKVPKLASSIDVARVAGVSQSAVSRTYTNGASVSEETKRKVIKAAEQLGYRPNALARAVLSRQSDLIGVVMGEIANPFYPEVLDLLLAALETKGYRVLLKRLEHSDTADAAIEEVLRYRVRGAIITASIISDEKARQCGRCSVPVVLFDRHVKDLGVTSVCCDNVEASRTVANLLLDAGCVRPALVSGPEEASTNRDRKKGFLDRLAERGVLKVPTDGGDNSHGVGYEVTKKLFAASPRPDAVFCTSDILAFGALDAVREIGLRVPEDVSIVGFDDVPMASWPAFNLTTIRQPREKMVQATVDALLGHIERGVAPKVRLVPGELILRGTVRASKKKRSARAT
jgi:DNA-binding LacI/PurR family transcriptional regulator